MKDKTTIDHDPTSSSLMGLSQYPDANWFRSARLKALRWFQLEQRPLPWRTKNTPYRVWVSEIMLQQTQVQTVIDYFNRFVARFPTINKLAEASESEVLSYWEGLGYYRRAKNLHAAAKVLHQSHNGKFPTTFEDVLNLPGIGRYTAGAILSIALDQYHPILEGNTYRLFARLLALTANPREREPEKLLWRFATDFLPSKKSKQQPGQLNQALMEIGAKICKPQNPLCVQCPFQKLCPTNQLELQSSIPKSGKKIVYEELQQALVIAFTPDNKVLVRESRPGEWWNGLWDFLRVDIRESIGEYASDSGMGPNDSACAKVSYQIHKKHGVKIILDDKVFATLKHAVTKFRITLDCYAIALDASQAKSFTSKKTRIQAKSIDQIHDLPLNVSARKAFTKLLNSKAIHSKAIKLDSDC